jgi:hypothetical protein
MKTAAINAWSSDEEALIGQIMHTYRDGKRIRWTQAFEDHPDWKDQLTSSRTLGAIFAKGNQLKAKGNLNSNRAATAKPQRASKRPTWSDEQQAAIIGVVANYTNGTGKARMTDYSTAFAEHPEWQDALKGKSPSAIYSMGQKIAQDRKKQNGKPEVVNHVDTAEPTAAKATWAVNGCPNCLLPLKPMNAEYAKIGYPALPHCPNCTFPLGIVRSAIRLANKHQHNGVA